MTLQNSITEMQALKAENPALSIDQVLKVFEIQAMKDLTTKIEHLRLSMNK